MFSKILFVFGVTIIASAIAVCNLNGKWGPACKKERIVPMDQTMKNAIVKVHNKLRNEIALGKIPHYSHAANMHKLGWDDELAAKALLNVHQCEMKHDSCHSTAQFKYAGQNLVNIKTTGAPQKSPDQMVKMITVWFNEQQKGGAYGWMDMINTFTTVGSGDNVVGHFTQFVWAKATKIGCAAVTSVVHKDEKDWNATWVACNYSQGNLLGAAVYEIGTAASNCSTSGKSTVYPGLCN